MTATRSRTGASSETPATAVAAPEAAAESSSSGGRSPADKAKAKAKKAGAGGKPNGGVNANGKAKANPARAKAKMQARKAKAAAAGEQGGDAATPPAAGKAGTKQQLIRDSFTIPKNEYHALDQLKKRAMGLEHEVRKGELLRAGIQALAAMSDTAFIAALKAVPTLKTGRPRREKAAAEADDSSED